MPELFGRETVIDTLNELKPEFVMDILEKSIKNTPIFEFRFYQVAKRFGIIDRDAQFSNYMMARLIDTYQGTPVFQETLHEIYREKLDVEGTKKLIEEINKGRVKIVDSSGYEVSPLGVAGLDYSAVSLIKPREKIGEIMEIIKERILKRKFWFYCLNCGKDLGTLNVENVPKTLICPDCKAKLIAYAPINEKYDIKKVLKKNKSELDKQERKMLAKFEETAELFINFGSKSVFVMAGYGIGPATAKRILSKSWENDEEMLKDIIAAERQFISTRIFW